MPPPWVGGKIHALPILKKGQTLPYMLSLYMLDSRTGNMVDYARTRGRKGSSGRTVQPLHGKPESRGGAAGSRGKDEPYQKRTRP